MEIEVGDANPLSLLSFSSFPSFLLGDFPALLAFAVNLVLVYFFYEFGAYPKVAPSLLAA